MIAWLNPSIWRIYTYDNQLTVFLACLDVKESNRTFLDWKYKINIFSIKASIFLLIDLREIFLRFWVGGAKKKLK